MKKKFIAGPLILTFVGNVVLAGENQTEIKIPKAEEVANYLSSLNQEARQRLASKLYYLDPATEKNETRKTLLDELTKQGRVRKDDNYRTGPRTVSTESGF